MTCVWLCALCVLFLVMVMWGLLHGLSVVKAEGWLRLNALGQTAGTSLLPFVDRVHVGVLYCVGNSNGDRLCMLCYI